MADASSLDTAALLRQCRLFRSMPEDELARVAPFVRSTRVGRGAVIVREDEDSVDMYLLFSGFLIAKSCSADGDEVAYGRIAPGEQFGETAALTGGRHSATVTALSKAQIGRVPAPQVRALIGSSPAFTLALIDALACEVRRLRRRLFARNTLSLSSRIRLGLADMARSAGISDNRAIIPGPLTHAEMAALVGSRREAVTREFGRLAAAGIIGRGRHCLHIFDVSALGAE
jgi:CRP-like cAMP-binding protein